MDVNVCSVLPVGKNRLYHQWEEKYEQHGRANAPEHRCIIRFYLDPEIQGHGRARNKKLAKQLAFKEVYQKLKFKEKLTEKKRQISQLMGKIDKLTVELDQAKIQQKTKEKNHCLEMKNQR